MGTGQKLKVNHKFQSIISFDQFKLGGGSSEDCQGYWRNYNCVFGFENYKWIMGRYRTHLFANKFDCNTKNSSDLITKIENELIDRELY